MGFFKGILKAYRFLLLLLFIACMIVGSIFAYHFYDFIEPIEYTTQSLGEVTEPGKLVITIDSTLDEPFGIVLISPSGRQYTQSSRDISLTTDGSSQTLSILTADIGEWKVRYRNIKNVDTSLSRSFYDSNAAILVDTKATVDSQDSSKYVVSMYMSRKNYSYTIKAVRRSDGFSLTSSGDGGATLNLEAYPYSGVWDFYINTTREGEEYSTMFSYTF